MDFTKIASKETIEKTMQALKANGIDAFFAETALDAASKTLELVPKGASVMTMTSITLDTAGITEKINESGAYDSIKKKLMAMNRVLDGKEMNLMGAAPDLALGSCHALTEDGHIMVASNTGSQLPAYAYAAGKVILVVGAQKIVSGREEGFRRIYEHCLPLESERAKKAYGVPGSAINKVLIINHENITGRITVIIVNQALGF